MMKMTGFRVYRS